MITYWAPRNGCFTVHEYLQQRGKPLANLFTVRTYESLERELPVRGSAHIFSAADQLTLAGRQLIGEVWDTVGDVAPAWKRLNDPRRVLLRLPLLQAMSQHGLNDFRARAASEDNADMRFPLFLRERDRHDGPLTGLLESPKAVRLALRSLRLRGHRIRDLIQVEYQDTADDRGRFRKYSAYRVGSAIVRTHMMIGSAWSVKSDTNKATLDSVTEERNYLTGNAHEQWLRQVFDIANIDFGRIDYGVTAGRPQLWEINMNPTIGRRLAKAPDTDSADIQQVRAEARAYAHQRLRDAFSDLASGGGETELTISLSSTLLRSIARERAARARREQAIAHLRRAFHSSVLGWPARAVYGTLARRG